MAMVNTRITILNKIPLYKKTTLGELGAGDMFTIVKPEDTPSGTACRLFIKANQKNFKQARVLDLYKKKATPMDLCLFVYPVDVEITYKHVAAEELGNENY